MLATKQLYAKLPAPAHKIVLVPTEVKTAYEEGYAAGYAKAFEEVAENRAVLKKNKHILDLMPID